EVADVRPPVALLLDPGPELRSERGQVEEEMLRLTEDRGLAVEPRAGVDQVRGVKLVAAVVALVAPSLGEPADRARALDVAVGERTPGARGERPQLGAGGHVALLVEGGEELLDHPVVVARRRPGEAVVGQPQL